MQEQGHGLHKQRFAELFTLLLCIVRQSVRVLHKSCLQAGESDSAKPSLQASFRSPTSPEPD